jgi:hypothetical protein
MPSLQRQPLDRERSVQALLAQLKGVDPLKELFWHQFNYDRANQPLSRRTWLSTAAGTQRLSRKCGLDPLEW